MITTWWSAALAAGAGAFVVALVATGVIRWLAGSWQIVDRPDNGRKQHAKATPLLGGLGIYLGWLAVIGWLLTTPWLVGKNISVKEIVAVAIAGLVIVVAGALDDRWSLRPWQQLIGPILAVGLVVAGGVGIDKVTNPLGGFIFLNQATWVVAWYQGVPLTVTLWSDLFSGLWLLGMMYTTKLLDGLDGLVSGIGIIGAVIIFLLSTTTQWWQPDTAVLAAVVSGAIGGFLVFNWHPASIFLGEGGALLVGFFLGILSIIAGGKIATALLIMGLPILDVIWVIARRLLWEKRDPFRTADRKHLHFRLLDAGFSIRQAVVILWSLALMFGSLALLLQSRGKLLALGALGLIMVLLAGGLLAVNRLPGSQPRSS
ncbi:MAG: MraY family glycosyltransferase [Patescibacteria group bacterium]